MLAIRGHRYPAHQGFEDWLRRLCRNYCLCYLAEPEPHSLLEGVDPAAVSKRGQGARGCPVIQAIVRAGEFDKAAIDGLQDGIKFYRDIVFDNTRLYRAFEQAWQRMRQPVPGIVGGHVYPGIFGRGFLFTSKCANLCGCSMGSFRSYSPDDLHTYPAIRAAIRWVH